MPPDAWRAGNLSSVGGAIRNPFTAAAVCRAIRFRSIRSRHGCSNPSTRGRTSRPAPRSTRRTSSSTRPATTRSTASTAASTSWRRRARRCSAALTIKNVDDLSPTGSDWNTTQGDHFRRTEVRQLAGSHNWIRGSFINEVRGGWSNTVEKDSYTNASQRRRSGRRRRPDRPAGRAGHRRIPAHRVRRRLVHLHRRRQAVRHPVARRSGRRTPRRGSPGVTRSRRAPTSSTSSTSIRSRSSTARSSAATSSTARSPATRSPTSCSACRTSPATSCRRRT